MSGSVSADTPAGGRALAGVPLFAELPEGVLRDLDQRATARGCSAGDVLRQAGDPAGRLLVLVHGRVAASTVTSTGRVVRFGEWEGPCALDKVAVIDGGGHTATLTALTDCALRTLPRTVLLRLVDDDAAVRRHVLRALAGHARERQAQFASAATLPTQARIAAWLLERAAWTGRSRVPLPGGQQALADSLGVTRVTVNRALSRLRRDGLIETTPGGEIVVQAPELLELRAGGGT